MKTIREDGANKKAARGFAKFLAIFIILSVAIFGDTMYAIQMQKVFAGNGLLMTFCYIAAFTSVTGVGYLLLGKLTVFEPGGQMWAAWIIFAMELIIIMLNIMVVFNHDKTGPMGTWAMLSPASPVFHMLGIAIVFFLDPELKEAHKDKEMASRQRQSDREYDEMMQEARLTVKRKHLDYTVKNLDAAINSPESQAKLQQHANTMHDGLLTELSGRSLPTRGSATEAVTRGRVAGNRNFLI
jgi:hypothetical protein